MSSSVSKLEIANLANSLFTKLLFYNTLETRLTNVAVLELSQINVIALFVKNYLAG